MRRIAVLLLVVLAACSGSPRPNLSTSEGTDVVTPPASRPPPADPLAAYEPVEVFVGGESVTVAVADEPAERASGLMNVTDLGDFDGMLFTFAVATEGGFWMKDTLIPLDIGFFDGDGRFLVALTMEPCTADPCPVYRPGVRYRYAIEVPEATLGWGDLVIP